MSIVKGQTCRFGDNCDFRHQQAQRFGNACRVAQKPRTAEVVKKPAAAKAQSPVASQQGQLHPDAVTKAQGFQS